MTEMHIRDLERRDAERMLEWMHDPYVVEKLQADFMSKTIEDCRSFIKNSRNGDNVHLAVADGLDRYMGTVSLKHITKDRAEFAITVRRDAMGKGFAGWAMREMITKGFEEYGLSEIYWCVAPDNLRALRFYDKNEYPRVPAVKIQIAGDYTKNQIDTYIWYQVVNEKHGADR